MSYRQTDALCIFTLLFNDKIKLVTFFSCLALINQLSFWLFLQPPTWLLLNDTADTVLPVWVLTLGLHTTGSFHHQDSLWWQCLSEAFLTAQTLAESPLAYSLLIWDSPHHHPNSEWMTLRILQTCVCLSLSLLFTATSPDKRSTWLSNCWLNECSKKKGITSVSYGLLIYAMTSYPTVLVVFLNPWVCFFWNVSFIFFVKLFIAK